MEKQIPSIIFDAPSTLCGQGSTDFFTAEGESTKQNFPLEAVMQLRGKIQPLKTGDPNEVIISILLLLVWCYRNNIIFLKKITQLLPEERTELWC